MLAGLLWYAVPGMVQEYALWRCLACALHQAREVDTFSDPWISMYALT